MHDYITKETYPRHNSIRWYITVS